MVVVLGEKCNFLRGGEGRGLRDEGGREVPFFAFLLQTSLNRDCLLIYSIRS